MSGELCQCGHVIEAHYHEDPHPCSSCLACKSFVSRRVDPSPATALDPDDSDEEGNPGL